MGADIHCYVETASGLLNKDGEETWWSFCGRVNPGRDYAMFGILASVRNDPDTAMIAPRGLPKNIGWQTADDAFMRVDDKHEEEQGYCSRACAEKYIEHGSWYRDEKKEQVSHPDWHSHSWMTPEEWALAIDTYVTNHPNFQLDTEYFVLAAMMNTFVQHGKKARIVFWFDN